MLRVRRRGVRNKNWMMYNMKVERDDVLYYM